jgi:hypothetical protein
MGSIKKVVYTYLKEYFEDEIREDNNILVNERDEILFQTFLDSFMNKYIENNQNDVNFRKNFIKKYANYLFMDSVDFCMSHNKGKIDLGQNDFEHILKPSNNILSLDSSTVFITHPWKGQNLTGNTNAYVGVVQNGFVHDQDNIKGFYIEDIDIAFIYNGNHSVSIGSIVSDISITTNTDKIISYTFKDTFFDAEIKSDSIIIDNVTVKIEDWKTAILFKLIQITYK